jgi:hypothetical protein
VRGVHGNPLFSNGLGFRQFSKHQICTKLFALPCMNWQAVASGALND